MPTFSGRRPWRAPCPRLRAPLVVLHRLVGERQAGGRVVVVGKVLLGGFEHRDRPLGLSERDVDGQPVRVEDRPRLGGLRLAAAFLEKRRPLVRIFCCPSIPRLLALVGQRAVERRDVVGRDVRPRRRERPPARPPRARRPGPGASGSLVFQRERAVEAARRDVGGRGRAASPGRRRARASRTRRGRRLSAARTAATRRRARRPPSFGGAWREPSR